MRINTVVIGIIAMMIASFQINLFNLTVIAIFITSITATPLFMKIIGLEVEQKQFLMSVIFGLGIFLIMKLCCSIDIKVCVFIGNVTAIISFITTHLFQNNWHFKYDNKNNKNSKKSNQKHSMRYFTSSLLKYLPTPEKVIQYSIAKVKEVGAPYQIFGIFCCINYATPYFLWSFDTFSNQEYIISIRFIASLLCVGLIMVEQWHKKIRKYLPLYWHFTVMFCLPFITTVTFFITQAQHGWLLNMALAMFFLAIIVDWQTFIILNSIGSILGLVFCNFFINIATVDIETKALYLTAYTFIFSTIIGMLFSKRRELKIHDKLQVMKLFGTSMAHEIKVPVGQLGTLLATLNKCWKQSKIREDNKTIHIEMPKKLYKVFNNNISAYSQYLEESNEIIDNLLICVQNSIKKEDFESFTASQTIKTVLKNLIISQDMKSNIIFKQNNDIKLFAPKALIKHVIINIIKNACKYALIKKEATLEITIDKNKIYFHDTGYGINEDNLAQIFNQFYSTDKAGTGLGLSFCKMVMEGIKGDIECISEEGKFTTFVLTFPLPKIPEVI